jgi:hypothetical protein
VRQGAGAGPAVVAGHRLWTRRAHRWKGFFRASLSESLWQSDHAIWDPYPGRTQRSDGSLPMCVNVDKARQPSYYPPHRRDPSFARGCRHQHNPGLARSCLSGNHKHLCRDRLRDQGQSIGEMRRAEYRAGPQALAGPARADGLPSRAVATMLLSFP